MGCIKGPDIVEKIRNSYGKVSALHRERPSTSHSTQKGSTEPTEGFSAFETQQRNNQENVIHKEIAGVAQILSSGSTSFSSSLACLQVFRGKCCQSSFHLLFFPVITDSNPLSQPCLCLPCSSYSNMRVPCDKPSRWLLPLDKCPSSWQPVSSSPCLSSPPFISSSSQGLTVVIPQTGPKSLVTVVQVLPFDPATHLVHPGWRLLVSVHALLLLPPASSCTHRASLHFLLTLTHLPRKKELYLKGVSLC